MYRQTGKLPKNPGFFKNAFDSTDTTPPGPLSFPGEGEAFLTGLPDGFPLLRRRGPGGGLQTRISQNIYINRIFDN